MKPVTPKVIMAGIVMNDGKVLIVQRSENDESFAGFWELPSGGKEPLEAPIMALAREVLEETGLKVKPVRPVHIFGFTHEKEDQIRDATQICYLCKPMGKPEVKLSHEHQAFAWVSKDEINNYNLSSETKEAILKAFEL